MKNIIIAIRSIILIGSTSALVTFIITRLFPESFKDIKKNILKLKRKEIVNDVADLVENYGLIQSTGYTGEYLFKKIAKDLRREYIYCEWCDGIGKHKMNGHWESPTKLNSKFISTGPGKCGKCNGTGKIPYKIKESE